MKYNLSVAVMQDDEPIMFIYSRDFVKTEGIGRFCVYETLKRAFEGLDWNLIKGSEDDNEYKEYSCSPDREREDMELLAIWQKMED